MGGKSCDFATMPLCPNHHTGDCGVHQLGVQTWEKQFGGQWEMVAKTLLRALAMGVLVWRGN